MKSREALLLLPQPGRVRESPGCGSVSEAKTPTTNAIVSGRVCLAGQLPRRLSLSERSAAVADERSEISSKGTVDSDSHGGRNQGAALVVGVGNRLNPVTGSDTLRLDELGGLGELAPLYGAISPTGLPESRRLPARAEGSMPERSRVLVGYDQRVSQQVYQQLFAP